MNKRFFSLLAAFALCLTLIPTTAFADDEKRGEDVSPCSCETACTVDNMNKECPVCGAEKAIPQNCGQYIPVEDRIGENGSTERADDPNGPTELSAADQVQAMIDGLPNAEEITEDNAEEVKAQLDAIDEAKEKLSDEEIDELDMTRYAEAAAALGALAAPMLLANDSPDEQFSLAPGGRYYFDLSGEDIPGTANSGNSDGAVSLPDTSLHYVPFTYVGTIEAYKLTSATVTTEEYAQQNKYPHSLFVADYAVTHTVSWDDLNTKSLIFGKNYASGGVDYTLRAPSVGSNSTGSGESQHDTPSNNEWDRILDKNSGYIQNWNKMYSWGQDTSSAAESFRAYRGYNSARSWYYTSSSFRNVYVGFRPVLEVLNPDTLGSDGMKAVTLDLNGGKLGGSSEAIQIIVKNGRTFTAPMSGGLTRPDGDTGSYFMWLGSNGKLYAPGAIVPADVTKLTAQFALSEQFSLTPGGRYYFDLSAMDIPGTANSNLPDSTLHYVPFTYAGTVNAYSLENEADKDTTSYEHSLFIANYNVTHTVSWDALNTAGLLFGKDYAGGGVNYTLRAPSAGFHYSYDQNVGGTPRNNEWDVILDKAKQGNNDNTNGYVKNWQDIYSWGQDKSSASPPSGRSLRGYKSSRYWYTESATRADATFGFRPVLKLPTDLAADNLKVVELRTVKFMPGEQQNWINIIVKNGKSFKAPAAEGLPRPDGISADAQLWWVDENSNFYKPGDTVPADVSALTALWGGFGLFLNRGDGKVEVTPDNYTDIFGDGTASFVLPKGKTLAELGKLGKLTGNDILGIYSTGRLEKYGCVFPNLKLKNADLTSVRLSEKYIGDENPLFVTLDGKNTVGSLNGIIESHNTLCVIGDGSLTLNSALTLGRYTQFGGGSVTMTDGLTAYDLSIDSGSLTVTGDPQAITLANQALGDLQMGDGVRLFTGSSAQDAAEAVIPQLSAEMQELYQRYLAGDNTLTYEELAALNNALRERFNAIFRQLPGKTYVRITGAWDVTYQPGTDGSGNAVTDIKFYNDALTLRGALFTRTGYTQVGWATVDGGEKVYDLSGVYTTNAALTLYPVWQTDTYAITYDLNGGTAAEGNPDSYTVETETITLKNPTRPGFTFTGWSGTGLTGEDNLTVTIPKGSTGDRSYTAHWRYNGGSSGGSSSYPITVPSKTENGTVTVSPKNASAGSTVTITVKPDSGYVLETISVTDKNGNDLKLTDKGGGKYTFTMPASKVEVKATFMEGNSVLNFFYDVPNDAYYYEAIKWAAENGVTGGIGNGLFGPNQPCTRAQIVTFLWRAAGSPVVNYLMPFTDVDEGAYYAEAVRWAASCGIVTGLTETTFGTNGVCTRAQAATMIYRYAQAQGKGFTGAWMFHLPFTDVPEWAYESVAWCYMNGVTTGVNETAFAPGNDCTRAQIVTFLWRAFGK